MAMLRATADGSESPRLLSVRVGDAVGPNWGRVAQLNARAVVIHEWVQDAAGVWRAQQAVLPYEGTRP